MSDAANPYRPGVAVERSFHSATDGDWDALRHEYEVVFDEGRDLPRVMVHLVVEESVHCIWIRVRRPDLDLHALPSDQRAAAIAWLAAKVLRLRGTHLGKSADHEPHDWVFGYRTLDEGARFSTAPDKTIFAMWSWADRVDGGVRGGQPYFLGHKNIEPTDGRLIFLNPHHWFDGQCWDAYRHVPFR